MSATKAPPPSQRVLPVTDATTILGYALGWAMIVVGLVLLGLSVAG